jgi:hypothetical protein
MEAVKKIFEHISNEWQWYNDSLIFPLFCYLIYKASHKPEKYKGDLIADGVVIFTERELTQIFSTGRSKVRKRIKWLELDGKIKCEKTNQNTICTIMDFEKYRLKFKAKEMDFNQVIRFLTQIEKHKTKAGY